MKNFKIAHIVSHPIQYQAPLFRYINDNSDIDLTVFFLSDFSLKSYRDSGFGVAVKWDVPLIGGYKHVVLPSIGSNDKITPLQPFVYNLYRYLDRGGFDALWLHGYAHLANIRALNIAKGLGIKVLMRADSQVAGESKSPLIKLVKRPLLRSIFSNVDAFLSCGTLNSEYYQRYGASKENIFLLPYAVDNDYFQAKAAAASINREAFRSSLGLQPDRPIILFASKFQTRKRAYDLLEAYIKLSPDGKQEPIPYLLFIGDGEQRPMLQAKIAQLNWNSVKLLGFKNQSEIPSYLDLCDLFVLPSDGEPWGLIVNEVMNAGKAVIVTDQVGAAKDLVVNGENGYIVPVGDINVLSDRLYNITSSKYLIERMGKSSLSIINRWGFKENLIGLEEALTAVCKNRVDEPKALLV